ncbi:MAG: D-glucuronyl C5-epimerase family protein [Thermoplasmata archaeon]
MSDDIEREKQLPPNKTYIWDLDENGVLSIKIPYTEEWGYYPLFIARYGLSNLEKYLNTKDEYYKKVFFAQIDHLYDNLVIKDDFGVWLHEYSLPWYDYNMMPWVLGLGQGVGLMAFLRAHEFTGEDRYLRAAEKVFRSFFVDIEDGGVRYIDQKGDIWLEEYAITPPPHVLNGFFTILACINEFYEYTQNEEALRIFQTCIKTVKRNLHRYDTGYWSLYDLLSYYPAAINYHKMHIRQLKELYEITGDDFFLDYAQRWAAYEKSWVNNVRKTLNRGFVHLKTKGLIGCVNRYYRFKIYRMRGK